MEYDDAAVLFDYVMRHCQHLMTDLERRADRAGLVRAKAANAAAHGRHDIARMILEKGGCVGDAEVDAALAEGYQPFRQRVFRRLMQEPGAQASINRCPRCGRIVQTPLARQCLWCKHDWHSRSGFSQNVAPDRGRPC